jgi:V-type H+-transporting ATPase subunit E
MKVLNAREDVLNEIFEDKAKYQKVLSGLIEEGLYALMDDSVRVRARKGDIDLVKKAIPDAEKAFKEKASRDVKIAVDEEDFLSNESAGGVVVESESGKIVIDNSLEERLKILSTNSLPQIRLAVFGPSPTRKFFD